MICRAGIYMLLLFFTILFMNKTVIAKQDPFPKKQPDLLYVQNILMGRFDGEILSLDKVSPLILYFSESPKHYAGHMTVRHFLEMWYQGNGCLQRYPPKATLSILSDTQINNTVMKLFSPEINRGVLQFKVQILSGEVPELFAAASLFIDAIPTPVNSQITDSVSQNEENSSQETLINGSSVIFTGE